MNHSRFMTYVRTTLALVVLWGCRQIQRLVQVVMAVPRTVVREILRPSTQYRIALVLVAVLDLLLGWSLALPHTETIPLRGNFL